ncbi:MAG: hypothetical protein AVDCRST_MAG72-785 [uncultured Nocardioidaceae bacterium]|uniref:Peptidase C45 hydrolase domain-containing protein n=1 Tax=uncultured Nocardioidaceae bacterium TaxID=253824 RepID=A0A6J4LTY7_9ACTN|nr:MAG: hypothetical protein AVDCRST_MAG72-785 [uncultured Nocardioidaceae bacterium]
MQLVRSFTSSALRPYERGAEFGSHHTDEIARNVAAYRRLFAARATGRFDVEEWARHAWHAIGSQAPWAVEEITGIAHGAGVPVHEIAALNARTELLAIANPTGVLECSTVVSLPPDGSPVACQTWDWYQAMADGWLVWTIPLPDGGEITTLTEHGVLGKIGVGAGGVGVLFNKLHHVADAGGTGGAGGAAEQLGYPLHLLCRRILETAADTAAAVEMARRVRVSASSAVTVVDTAGRAVSLELFPGGTGIAEPIDGLLVRTNHFIAAEGRAGCLAHTIGEGSEIRRRTLLSELAGSPPGSSGPVLEAMHDHADVGGVCAHPDPALEPVLQHATLATVVIDVESRSLRVTPWGPCARHEAATTAADVRTSGRT